jgi:hypothetical protein
MDSTATSGGRSKAQNAKARQHQPGQPAQRKQHPRHKGQAVQASTPARPTPSHSAAMPSIQSMGSQVVMVLSPVTFNGGRAPWRSWRARLAGTRRGLLAAVASLGLNQASCPLGV